MLRCRNCDSFDWYSKAIEANAYGFDRPKLLPIGWTSRGMPRFEIQVCGNCGLTEWFVPKKLLPNVKKKFSRKALG
jgi:hypothetical protein